VESNIVQTWINFLEDTGRGLKGVGGWARKDEEGGRGATDCRRLPRKEEARSDMQTGGRRSNGHFGPFGG